MNKIWNFLKRGNNLIITLLILLFFGAGIVIYFQNKRIDVLNDKYGTEVRLKNALIDSVSYVTNQYGEVVAKKLTLQEDVSNLEKLNNNLTESQKELLKRVKNLNKDKSIITAALINAEALIDSLKGSGIVIVNPKDSTICFIDTTQFISYNIEIGMVMPINQLIEPTLLFKRLAMPNKQFVEFHWENDKKVGYPIMFSVSNSNPYFKTYNINSYAIPVLKKEVINPTGWQKVGKWFNKNGKTVMHISVGVAIGAGLTYGLIR